MRTGRGVVRTGPGVVGPRLGAFDDAADFAAHDVVDRQDDLRGIAVRVDHGRGDGFAPAVRHHRAGFEERHEPAGGLQAGTQDESYWRRVAPAELAFLGKQLLG